jgi:starch synthase (maltosyl-transferring)
VAILGSRGALLPDSEKLDGRRRVVIDAIRPCLDGGRTAIKRVVGDRVRVETDLLVDGHDRLAGRLLYRLASASTWSEVPLSPVSPLAKSRPPGANDDGDAWSADFMVDALGSWQYAICGWVDAWETWVWGVGRKLADGQDVSLELRAGATLAAAAAARAQARAQDQSALQRLAERLRDAGSNAAATQLAFAPEIQALMRTYPDRSAETRSPSPLVVTVEPVRARFSSWYEMFPRSRAFSGGTPGAVTAEPEKEAETNEASRHGTFKDAERRLPYIADLGFDVVYLPPIHPIGRTLRKGPDNSLTATESDPGSPWAIGARQGGHKAIHPELGTLDDFHHFLETARQLGLEVALDIALQASPDHPYVTEHPEWFVHRADGSIQYAENPPKKYQDIYPFDFSGPAWESLWEELRSIFLYWIAQGVSIFRVDNPHTKPLPFWRWCISSIKERHPEVLFLAEAFTRPKLMHALAKVGFSQSYTYFTWRTTKWELTTYVQSLLDGDLQEFFRPSFWPNTPDILPEHLQVGTRATFIVRAVLAATLSPSWGIYGPAFELLENKARAGSEEYAHNEKYELRRWDLGRADSLAPVLGRLNRVRHDNPALQALPGTVFHETDNDALLCFSRVTEDGSNALLVVVNLDPHNRQSGWISLDLQVLGVEAEASFQVHDLIGDARYLWTGGGGGSGRFQRAFVALDPGVMPAHVFRVLHHVRSERAFEYYL